MSQEAKPLNPKQQRFVEEYLVDLNATQAAIRAGYSQNSAAEQAYDLLRKPQIAQAIQARREELTRSTGVTVERVIKELAAIAFANPRDLFHESGALKAMHELPAEAAAAIASIEVTSFTPPGEDAQPEFTKKVRHWDKVKALALLLEHFKGAEVEQRLQAIEEQLATKEGVHT